MPPRTSIKGDIGRSVSWSVRHENVRTVQNYRIWCPSFILSTLFHSNIHFHSLVRSFFHSVTRSFFHSFFHSFIHSFIHSFFHFFHFLGGHAIKHMSVKSCTTGEPLRISFFLFFSFIFFLLLSAQSCTTGEPSASLSFSS